MVYLGGLLLSDAEMLKYVAKYLIGGDLSGYFTKIMHCFTNILREEIT